MVLRIQRLDQCMERKWGNGQHVSSSSHGRYLRRSAEDGACTNLELVVLYIRQRKATSSGGSICGGNKPVSGPFALANWEKRSGACVYRGARITETYRSKRNRALCRKRTNCILSSFTLADGGTASGVYCGSVSSVPFVTRDRSS